MKEKIKACWKSLLYLNLPLWMRILILVMFVVGSIGVFMIFSSKSPKSAKAPAQPISIEKSIQATSEQNDSHDKLEQITFNMSCNNYFIVKIPLDIIDINNYDSSLDLLLFYIPKISECNKRSSASSSDYKYESLLYQKLAETLKLKGDTKRAEQALAKSKTAKEMAATLLVKERKQQEKDLDKVLADTAIKK